MRRSAVFWNETLSKNPSTKNSPARVYIHTCRFQLYIAPSFRGGLYPSRGGSDRGLGAEYPWWFKPVRYITHVLMFGTIGAGACAMVGRRVGGGTVGGGKAVGLAPVGHQGFLWRGGGLCHVRIFGGVYVKNSEKAVYEDLFFFGLMRCMCFFCCVFFAWSFYFFVCVLV